MIIITRQTNNNRRVWKNEILYCFGTLIFETRTHEIKRCFSLCFFFHKYVFASASDTFSLNIFIILFNYMYTLFVYILHTTQTYNIIYKRIKSISTRMKNCSKKRKETISSTSNGFYGGAVLFNFKRIAKFISSERGLIERV